MTTGTSRELVEAYFKALLSRDPLRIAQVLHDDIEWSLGGPVDLLPFCGQRHGKKAVIDTMVRLAPTSIRLNTIEMEQLLVDGDRAAAFMRISGILAATGRTVSYKSAQFLRFRDGKLRELRALFDTFDAAEQFLGHPIDTSLKVAPELATTGNRIAL